MNWKKIILRTITIIVTTIAVVVIATFLVVRSSWFHHKVLTLIVEKGQAATGGKLQLQNWDFQLRPLTIDLYGIVLHGSEPEGARPLLAADRLTVGLRVSSLLDRKVHVSEILIQHPVVSMTVARNGQSNVPSPRPSNSESNVTIWNLAVSHTLLTDGEVFYNDKKAPVSADLYDLTTEVRFDPLATRYTGTVSYRNGRLQYATYSALPHELQAKFSATPDRATLTSLLLKLGKSQVSLHGELVDYSKPSVNAAYVVTVHTQDFASFSPGTSPAGDVQISGGLEYQDLPNQPMLCNLSANGSIATGELQATSPQERLLIRNLRASYRLANGNLDLREVAADVFGGQLTASLGIRRLDATPEGIVHASVTKASIESAKRSARTGEVRQMPITGTVDASVDGNWTGSLKNIRLLGSAVLRAAVWNPDHGARESSVPLDARLHVVYAGLHNQLTLHQTMLRIPSTSVVLDGSIGDHSDLQVHAMAGDLHQLTKILNSLGSGTGSAKEIEASGSAKLDAVVQGAINRPSISGQLSAESLEVQGSQWKSARLALQANPSELKISQGSLVSAKQGDVNFSADIKLKNWAYQPSNRIQANLTAHNLSIGDLDRLANRQDPVSGNLSGNISLQGTQLNPAGHGSLQISKGSAYDESIQNLSAQFQAVQDSISSTLNVSLPAGSATANLTFTPKTKAYKVDLHTSGIVLQKLQTVQAKNLPLQGTLTASANGAGSVEDPQFDIQLQIPSLNVHGTNITQMMARLNVANHRAEVMLNSNIDPAFIHANATVDLDGAYETEATIDTNKVLLDPFLAVYVPSLPAEFHSESELHATLRGPLKDKSRIVAQVTIPTLSGSYQSIQFANTSPIRIDYSNSVLVLAPAEIRGTESSLRFQGRVPLEGNAAMNVQGQGNINLKLLTMFNSDLNSTGAVDFDVRGAGSIQNPELQGKVQIKNAALTTSSAPVGLSRLNGTLNVMRDRVEITELSGEVGGGKISAGGSITYRPSLQFNVALQGNSVRVLYPDGVRTVLDTNLTFGGNLQAASLKGRTLIDSLSFTPDFDLAGFAGQFGSPSIPSSGQSFADNITLAIAVQSAQNLSARSSQLNLAGAANLQVVGTAANPVVTGRVDLTSGELFFMSNRYQLQRGIVTFDDPNQTNPVLNVQATAKIEQYNLTLSLIGPLNRLSTSYVSDPSLPTADIISLVYRGQTTEEATAAGTTTDALLAGQAASRVSGTLQTLTGISSLQIDPLLGGSNGNPSARVAIQQRVTKDFLFTFSTDVTQPEQEIIRGEYQITKRWSVSAERDQLGGVSVDGRLHTHF